MLTTCHKIVDSTDLIPFVLLSSCNSTTCQQVMCDNLVQLVHAGHFLKKLQLLGKSLNKGLSSTNIKHCCKRSFEFNYTCLIFIGNVRFLREISYKQNTYFRIRSFSSIPSRRFLSWNGKK